MMDGFVKAFEDIHRGPRDAVKARFKVYESTVKALHAADPEGKAVDLVCGRGEWIEILTELGVSVLGIDTHAVMVEICRQRGLRAENAAPLAYLQACASDSLSLISGFQLAEHIDFADLVVLTKEAYRVLKPGGLFLLETPNPENLGVGSHAFYEDPRHRHPIAPRLLAFLPEYCGFERIKLIRTGERVNPAQHRVTLRDVLEGVSPSSAVIAQKTGRHHTIAWDIEQQALPKGTELAHLAASFDDQAHQQMLQLQALIHEARTAAMVAHDAARQAHESIKVTQDSVNSAQAQLDQIHQSTAWKLYLVFEWLAHQYRLLKKHGPFTRFAAASKKAFFAIARRSYKHVSKHPWLHRHALTILHRLHLYEALKPQVTGDLAQTPLSPTGEPLGPLTVAVEQEAYTVHRHFKYMGSASLDLYAELTKAHTKDEDRRS